MNASYSDIKGYCNDFATALDNRTNGDGITGNDYSKNVFAVIMDSAAVQRLLNLKDACGLAALIGVESGSPDRITVSLLAVNDAGEILSGHVYDDVPGEQNWEKKVTIENMSTFLP